MKPESCRRNSLAVIVLLTGFAAPSAADLPERNTQYHDSLDALNRALGRGGDAFTNGESVDPWNGNLLVAHPASGVVPIDAGGAFGLSRVYNSLGVGYEVVADKDGSANVILKRRLVGRGWLGLGWRMHLGRIATIARWTENTGSYSSRNTFFETPAGVQVRFSPRKKEEHPDIRAAFHPLCDPGWGPPCCQGPSPTCAGSPICDQAGCDEEAAVPYYTVETPDGATYRLEERVTENFSDHTHYVLNHDRAGWYVTEITNAYRQRYVRVEYHDGPYPEAIKRIWYQYSDGTIAEILTDVCSAADVPGRCPEQGLLKRVTSPGPPGATILTDFFYTTVALTDDYDGTMNVPLLDHVTITGKRGAETVDGGTTTYVYDGVGAAGAPSQGFGPLLERVTYPLGAATEFEYGEFLRGLRPSVGSPETGPLRLRPIVGVRLRREYADGYGANANRASWAWERAGYFGCPTGEPTRPDDLFRVTKRNPAGVTEVTYYNGHPCGQEDEDWGSWGTPFRVILSDGSGEPLRTVDFTWDSTIEQDGEITRTLKQESVTTFEDDDRYCFDGLTDKGPRRQIKRYSGSRTGGYWATETIGNVGQSCDASSRGYMPCRPAPVEHETTANYYSNPANCGVFLSGAYNWMRIREGSSPLSSLSQSVRQEMSINCQGAIERRTLIDNWNATTPASDDTVIETTFDALGNRETVSWTGGQSYPNGESARSYSMWYATAHGMPEEEKITTTPAAGETALNWKTLDQDVALGGFVTATRDPSGISTTVDYDALGRPVLVQRPGTSENPVRTVYDGMNAGGPREIRQLSPDALQFNPGDHAQQFAAQRLDPSGRVVRTRKALADGSIVAQLTAFDDMGRVVFVSEWMLESDLPPTTGAPTWQVDRDGDGQMDYRIYGIPLANGRPRGTVLFYGPPANPNGHDPLDLSRTDALNRVHRVERADGSVTEIEHCGLHEQVTEKAATLDPDGDGVTTTADLVTRRYRDGLGRLVLVDSPPGNADAEYTYDAAGGLVKVNLVQFGTAKDPFAAWLQSPLPDGQVRRFNTDGLGRVRHSLVPEEDVAGSHVEWDGASRQHGRETLAFDNWGNPLAWTDPLGTERGYRFEARYDLAGRLAKLERVHISSSGAEDAKTHVSDGFETGTLAGSGWEEGYLSGTAFNSLDGGRTPYWKVESYSSLASCGTPVSSPPAAAGANIRGLHFGTGCGYNDAPAEARILRQKFYSVKRDDVLTFKFWRQVREGASDRDLLSVYVARGHADSLGDRKLLLRMTPAQASYAQWQRVPDIRIADVYQAVGGAGGWPEGTTENIQVLFVFEKGDTTSNTGVGLLIDDVFVGRRGRETLAELKYDETHCQSSTVLVDACQLGVETVDRAAGKLTTARSFIGGSSGATAGAIVDERRLVYRGLGGRLSGEDHFVDWRGVLSEGPSTAWTRWTGNYSYGADGALQRLVAPYLPGGEKREYAMAYQHGFPVRITNAVSGYNFVSSVAYGAPGSSTTISFGNGTSQVIGSDVLGRTTAITGDVPNDGATNLQTDWQTGDFSFDNAGNILSMDGSASFGYDEGGRLTRAAVLPQNSPSGDTRREVMRYRYDRYGNMIESWRDPNGPALNQAILTFASSCIGGACDRNQFSSTSWMGVGGGYDANGNTTAFASQLATQAGATWTASKQMDTYYEGGTPWGSGTPGQRYLYDASGFRVVRWDVGTTGLPLITLRGPDGTALAEYEARPGGAAPALVRDLVHGLGRVLVEREVTNPAPLATAGSPFVSGSSYGIDVSTGAGSYTLDVETRSGWSNLHAGLVATTAGRILVPESELLAGESNFLRFRKESPPETGYSAPVTLTLDPTVNSASPNQVRSLAVSRSGNNILLRWSVATDNGKGFRIYFRPKDGGTTVLLTPQGLASTARSYTVSSQALASGCLEFFLRQFTVQGETADGPHTDLGTPLAGSDGRANDPCQPGGGSGSNAPSGYTFLEHFQMRDHLGSLRVVSDETGAVEEKLDFYPFGQEISFGTLGDESERKYTGHQRDGRTGLDYMMARFKAPWMGSFQSPDPIDDVSLDVPWSWNRYAYVRGNPVLLLDPTGLASLNIFECTKIGGWWVDGKCVLPAVEVTVRPKFRLRGFRIPLRGGFGFGRGAPGLPGPPTPPGPDDARPPCVEIEPETEWWRYMGSVENTLEGPVGAFVVGFGDGASMGIVPFLRSAENWQRVDTGGWYLAGNVTGEAWMAVASAGATAERNVFIHHLPGGPYKGFLGQPKSTEWIRKFLLRWGKDKGQTWHMNLVGKWHVPAQCH